MRLLKRKPKSTHNLLDIETEATKKFREEMSQYTVSIAPTIIWVCKTCGSAVRTHEGETPPSLPCDKANGKCDWIPTTTYDICEK